MTANYGVSVTGGNVTAGAIAAGAGAHASSNGLVSSGVTLDDLRRALDGIRTQVVEEVASLDDADQAIAVTELAQRELAKHQPDKGRVLGFLSALAAVVSPAAAITESVAALSTAVSQVL
jgi:hypothetical protein